jgi:hypothetical protein
VQHLKPLELVYAVRRALGEREFPMAASEDFFTYPDTDILEVLSGVLLHYFKKYLGSHGEYHSASETITMVSGTTEYTLTEQQRFGGVVAVEDESNQPLEEIGYNQSGEWSNRRSNAFYLRNTALGLAIGVIYPDVTKTVTVKYVVTPRVVIGGRGVSSGGTGVGAVSAPWWANITSGYYATTNYVQYASLVNGKPSGVPLRGAVVAYTSAVLTFASTLIGSDIWWCVEPEWAPYEGKELFVKKTVLELMGHAAPSRLSQEVELAELNFRGAYSYGQATAIMPHVLRDEMD